MQLLLCDVGVEIKSIVNTMRTPFIDYRVVT